MECYFRTHNTHEKFLFRRRCNDKLCTQTTHSAQIANEHIYQENGNLKNIRT